MLALTIIGYCKDTMFFWNVQIIAWKFTGVHGVIPYAVDVSFTVVPMSYIGCAEALHESFRCLLYPYRRHPFLSCKASLTLLEGVGINGHGHSCDHVTAQESSLLKILYITNSGNFSNESNDLCISVLRNIL